MEPRQQESPRSPGARCNTLFMSSPSQSYSDRLGRIADSQLQRALDRFNLGRLIEAEPVPFGHSGQNVFLTSSNGDWVLRGAPIDASQLRRERFMIQELHSRTSVLVPWPYLLDESDDIFGWTYAVMPRLPGLQLVDPTVRASIAPQARLALADELGKTLSSMQAVTWPHPGEYDVAADTVEPLPTDHATWINAKFRARLLITTGISEDEKAWAADLMDRATDALSVPFSARLVMLDFHENNILATEGADGAWRLGVVDFASAYFGDGERDVARCCAAYGEKELSLARAAVQAYAGRSPFRPMHEERFRAYMLLDRLLVWGFALKYGKWWDEKLSFRAWAIPFVRLGVFDS